MKRLIFIGFLCWLTLSLFAQENFSFVYRKGKIFDYVPAFKMDSLSISHKEGKTGILEEKAVPEGQTTLRYLLRLPAYEEGVFFSRDYRKGDYSWPHNTNRLLPWFFRNIADLSSEEYTGIPSNGKPLWLGEALLLHLKNGKYLFLKTVAGKNSLSWFQIDSTGALNVLVSTLGKDALCSRVPLVLSAEGENVYTVLREAYEKLAGNRKVADLRLREKKQLYGPFHYLGWCTWEQYRKDIHEKQLLTDIQAITASGLPIRYVLIDDGHVENTKEQLKSFRPDRTKFPSGWESILNTRKENGIRWMGLWYGFPGYWQGISSQNDFPDYIKRSLYDSGSGRLPGKTPENIRTYYRYYVETLKNYGFDFLKIDIQSLMLPLYMGGTEVVRQARDCNLALEKETHRLGIGLMNCMAQNILNMDHTRYSTVSRVSIDYKKWDEDMARSHLFQSYANTLLQGQAVWPDHDMFHSCDSLCGGMMARSKAMSGGPVYLSDAPEDFMPERIWPLVNEEGRIYRPQAPAVPATESVFTNPVYSGEAYRVVAPVGENAMAMVCYNLNKEEKNKRVTALLHPDDYLERGNMMRKKIKKPERLVLYDWEKQTAEELRGEKRIVVTGFTDRLFHFCPVIKGWAVIGLQEKYLSPATVKVIRITEKRLVLKVLDKGTLRVWVDKEGKQELRSVPVDRNQRLVLTK